MRKLALLTCTLVCAAAALARTQSPEPLWPGARYDPAIPTLKQVLGHDPGMEITSPEGIGTYLQALAKAAPERTRLIEYARTWENRPLWLLVVANPDRMARLDDVKRGLQQLADPRGLSAADADRLVRELPAVVWLVHGVHGNEISSADAALQEAYHLLAAQGDADVDSVMRDAIVLIDPMQNPDGRARFLFQNLQARAMTPDPAPFNAEHDEPWPGGRSNHYLFDMNRDWFAQTQPETRGRITIAREYWPHVTVDLHEQGGNNTYYFAPPAAPLNPHIPPSQIALWDLFGRANAARFDARGWPYFIREVYDAFYPGYGDSWPTFQGSIGMTFEQASARSLSFARSDGTTLTYRDGVMRHFNAAMMTAITAARHRERVLRDFLEYRRSAITEGEKSQTREYVIVPGPDRVRAERLARMLATQGIDVRRADEAVRVGDRQVPAGAYLISHAQPSGRLLRNLLDAHTPQPEDFLKRQEERRARRLPDEIYDITAWNLPHLFDVEVLTSSTPLSVRTTPVTATFETPPLTGTSNLRTARVAYLIPWGSGAAALVAEALRDGIRIWSAGDAFTLGGRVYPIGTAIVRVGDNPSTLHARLSELATKHGAEVVPTDTSYVESGISLGSNDVVYLKAPRVLLAWDSPTSSLSAGWTRYVLERRFHQPVTIVRSSSLGRVPLNEYDVLILPSGSYGSALNEAALTRVKDWLRAGGTLVTIAEASRWATGSSVGLLDTQTLMKDGTPDVPASGGGGAGGSGGGGGGGGRGGGAGATAGPGNFDYDRAIQPTRERPASQPGAILRATLDTDHWLSAGHDTNTFVMVEGNRVFAPIKLNAGRNVGLYARKESLIASGLVWPENQDLLVQKPFLIHQPYGQGHVVAFAEDPNFRGFSEGMMLLFMNAVLLGPGF